MSNSKIVIDEVTLSLDESFDNTERLREKESTLLKIIEALEGIKVSEDWSTLKLLIFDSLLENLEKRLKSESEQLELKPNQIHQLQGQLFWARKYADLDKLTNMYRVELANIRKKYE